MSTNANPTATANADAARIGALAVRIADLHYAYLAAIQLSRHPDAASLMPAKEPGQLVPLGRSPYTDGASEQRFDFRHYLRLAEDPDATGQFDRSFFMGALLTLGDALQVHRYFDHSPELELIYHLRNGVAHGNRFTFTKAGKGMVGRRVRQNGSGCVHGCATAAPPRASMPTPEHERWNEDRVARELEARYGRRHLQRAGLRFADWHRAEGFCPRGRGGWITMVTVVSGRPASEMPGPGARPAQVKKPTVVATTAAAALIFALDQREGSGGGGELW